eukprot:GGOE01012036.1.p1 GENE.GGOE01012036.1~~GGOE01012036.1.p1  ORF type:complete len:159 (-),score=4.33 GGOE01012036.1:338-814(-)
MAKAVTELVLLFLRLHQPCSRRLLLWLQSGHCTRSCCFFLPCIVLGASAWDGHKSDCGSLSTHKFSITISSVSNAIQPPSYKAHPCAIDVLFVCAAMIILCTKSWIIACMVCSGTVHVEALGLLPSALTSVSPPISALSTAPPSRFLPLAARPLLHLA